MRAAIDTARNTLVRTGNETVLFVDEVHRFSKAQQDALLPGVENRWVTLVAATTENPFFSVISPLLSRSLLLRLESLTDDDVRSVMQAALAETPPGRPAVPVYANVIARPVSKPDEIARLLVEQVTGAVRWRESVLAMVDAGVTHFVEWAGKVLTPMVSRISPDARATSVVSAADLDALLKDL